MSIASSPWARAENRNRPAKSLAVMSAEARNGPVTAPAPYMSSKPLDTGT